MNIAVDTRPNPVVVVGQARFGNALPLTLIAGPCASKAANTHSRWRPH